MFLVARRCLRSFTCLRSCGSADPLTQLARQTSLLAATILLPNVAACCVILYKLHAKMQDLIPAIPYPPMPQPGYWYPITSTIKSVQDACPTHINVNSWCEEDYYATPWVAELINTFTNLLFVMLAIKGVINCVTQHHERIYSVVFLGYAAVGTGSILFHASLKYPMQLVDELSMIYTACLMCFTSFSFRKPFWYTVCMGIGFAGLAIFITWYYHVIKDPQFHQRAFALLTATVLSRSMIIMELNLRPRKSRDVARHKALTPSEKNKNGEPKAEVVREWARQDTRDRKIIATMWTMVAYGLTVFLTGFLIWSLDNRYCTDLRRWRRHIGLPWGILLEGHAWW